MVSPFFLYAISFRSSLINQFPARDVDTHNPDFCQYVSDFLRLAVG